MIEVRYEVFLARIEVIRGNRNAEEDDNVWRVTLDRRKPGVTIASGLLRTSTEGGVGRVLVHAVLMGRDVGAVLPTAEELRDSSFFPDCLEAIYDTGRRALNAQAALMDFSFDLAISAPQADVRISKRRRRTPTKPSLAKAE